MPSNSVLTKIQPLSFKIVLLGEGCVGKTSLITRFVENKFNESHVSTLQASFLRKNLVVDSHSVTISIWDTAGQERFHALGPIYYRDSNGAVVVYDVTDPDSLHKTKKWIKELKSILGDSVCLAVVGNKVDLLPNQDNPTNDIIKEGQLYGNNITNSVHYLTSAKINYGIDDMFLDLTRRMIQLHAKNQTLKANSHGGLHNNRTLRIEDNPVESETASNYSKCNC